MAESKDPLSYDQDVAAFNMAALTNVRINRLFYLASEYFLIGDYEQWKKALDVLYRETITVNPRAKENPKINDNLKELKKKVNESLKKYVNQKQNPNNRMIQTSLPSLLDEWEIQLRSALDKKGLLTTKSSDPRSAIMKGHR